MQEIPQLNNPNTSGDITLIYMREFDNRKNTNYCFLDYIHNCRSKVGVNNPEILAYRKATYYTERGNCVNEVSKYFCDKVDKVYDAIIYAPSSTNMHLPFYIAIEKEVKYNNCRIEFFKDKSAGASNDFNEFYCGFKLETPITQIKNDLDRILIIDDMYARGFTTAAIIRKLECNGITVKKTEVFAPLKK